MATDPTLRMRLERASSALQEGRFQGALKILDRGDTGALPVGMALRGLALCGQGSLQEALALARHLATRTEEIVQDKDALSLTAQLFSKLELVKEHLALLDRASAGDPNVIEVHLRACLRHDQFDKVLIVCTRAAKYLENARPLSWVAAVKLFSAMEISANREEIEKELHFATMMLEKAVAYEKSILGKADAVSKSILHGILTLVIEAKSLQGNFEEAHRIIDGDMQEMAPRDLWLLRAELFTLEGNFAEAREFFMKLVKEIDPEDWRNWSGVLESYFNLAELNDEMDAELLSFMTVLKQSEDGRLRRAPHLAKIHFHLRKFMKTGSENAEMETLTVLKEYFAHFASKACCFGDLRNVLLAYVDRAGGSEAPQHLPNANRILLKREAGLSPKEKIWKFACSRRWPQDKFSGILKASRPLLLSFLEGELKTSKEKMATSSTRSEVRTLLTYYQCLRFLGGFDLLDVEETLQVVDELLEMYERSKELDDPTHEKKKELKEGDDFVVLACHFIVDLCDRKSRDDSQIVTWLLGAAGLLEEAFAYSSNGFQLALMLVEVYTRLDILERAAEVYRGLSIKFIQQDSLSHFLFGDFVRTYRVEETLSLWEDMNDFYQQAVIQDTKFCLQAMSLMNLTEVVKILAIKRRLRFSHQKFLGNCERFLAEIANSHLKSWERVVEYIDAETSDASLDVLVKKKLFRARETRIATLTQGVDLEGLAWNYDFTTQVSWDSPGGSTALAEKERMFSKLQTPIYKQSRACTSSEAYVEQWYSSSILWMRLRLLCPRMLAISIQKPRIDSDTRLALLAEISELKEAFADGFWQVVLDSFAVTFEVIDEGAPDATARVDAIAAKFEESAADALRKNGNEAMKCFECGNALLLMTLLVRSWGDLANKLRKKKKRAEEIRRALRELTKKLQAFLQEMRKGENDDDKDLCETNPFADTSFFGRLKLSNETLLHLKQRFEGAHGTLKSEKEALAQTFLNLIVKVKF